VTVGLYEGFTAGDVVENAGVVDRLGLKVG
jgi:hypothetical protein